MTDDSDRLPCSDVVCGLGGHRLCTGRYRTPEEQAAIPPPRTSLHNRPASQEAYDGEVEALMDDDSDGDAR